MPNSRKYHEDRNNHGFKWEKLDQSENLLYDAIYNYFSLKWARNYVSNEDENRYCTTILNLCETALDMHSLPPYLNSLLFLDPDEVGNMKVNELTGEISIELSCKLISRIKFEKYFLAVADYLSQKMNKPNDLRVIEQRVKIQNA